MKVWEPEAVYIEIARSDRQTSSEAGSKRLGVSGERSPDPTQI